MILFSFRTLAQLATVATLVTGAKSATAQDIGGIYHGTMELVDGTPRSIPLQVALTITGEREIVDGVPQYVIDANFLIDDEGGPFGFSKVHFDINSNILELSYFRPQETISSTVPAFYLKSQFSQNMQTLSGEVQTARSGLIGTFQLTKTSDRTLTVRTKYQGRWQGVLIGLPAGERTNFEIGFAESHVPGVNPIDFEFEYTRGKTGYYSLNGFHWGVTSTNIDYLRRKFYMAEKGDTGETVLQLEFSLSPDGNTVTGTLNSVYGGRRGTFTATKIP